MPINRLPSEPDSPAPGQPAGQDAPVLWLVSFGDEDDRELVSSQIAAALRKGEIDASTIVWRDGLADWLPISSVPALAALIPKSTEATTAPLPAANPASPPKAAPTEDVTTAPGLGDGGEQAAAPPAQPVAKISLKPATQPKAVTEEVATVKAGDAPAEPGGKPAWRGKTKLGLPKVDLQRPEIARRLEPVKAPAAKTEGTAKPVAAVPRAAPVVAAKPPEAPPAAKAAAPPAVTPPEDVEPETSRPVPAAAAAADAAPTTPANAAPPAPANAAPPAPANAAPPAPEHSPEAPTAKLPEVTKTEARKPPVPDRRPPPIRNTIAGVGVTLGSLGANVPKAAPKPPASRGPQPPAPREPFVSPKQPDRESHPPTSAKAGARGARNIWDDDDDEPISVDLSSVRPPTPSPSPNIAKATALSSGTLGLTRKPAPKPPTPKGAPKPPPPPPPPAEDMVVEMTPGTPSLEALSAPLSTRTEGERVDDLLHLQAAPVKVGILAPPTFQPPAAPTPLEELPSSAVVETDDAQPTAPLGLDAPLDALTKPPAPANEAHAKARPQAAATTSAAPPAPQKKRSLVPFFVMGALAAVAISVGLRKLGGSSATPEPAPVEQPQARVPEAPPEPLKAEPPPAEPPPEPAKEPPKPAAAAKSETPRPATGVVGGESTPKQKPEPAAKADPVEKPEPAPRKPAEPAKPVEMGGEFDRAAAASALGAAATAAAGCRKEGDPSGLAVVKVTFTNSGKATRAVIEGPPFAGTATGGCIAAQMRAAKVPPFGGDRVTVTKRVVIQ